MDEDKDQTITHLRELVFALTAELNEVRASLSIIEKELASIKHVQRSLAVDACVMHGNGD